MNQTNKNNSLEATNTNRVLFDTIGKICFLQQLSVGYGDYTKEKYENEDITPEEAEALMESFSK